MSTVTPALPVPAANWSRGTDVVVVGSGASGLMTAVALADAGSRVTVVTKGALGDGSTVWAQGGLAAVLGADDDAELHVQDTLAAGAGLCDEEAVRTLVAEAPAAVAFLQELGARLDLGPHALRARGVEVLEHTAALEALRAADGQVCGLRVAGIDRGRLVSTGDLLARAVVLATGGYGQVYAATSNPPGATGDGLALALRAGAEVADVEMVQFHPTVLWTGPGAEGQQVLVSEAVRGEGAVLVDRSGRRIMPGAHPLADLAPRDVVSATVAAHLAATGEAHVWLDATALGADHLAHRFPGVLRACREAGIDPVREPIPVAPAAHYTCGGVVAGLDGATTVPGLSAVGEVACTGVQGANRLASNSITEGLVAARRCAARLATELLPAATPLAPGHGRAVDPKGRNVITTATTRHAGVVRDADGLTRLGALLGDVPILPADRPLDLAAVEATALHTAATLLATAALARPESRGCHRRSDASATRPDWQVRLVHRLDASGHLHTRTQPVRALVGARDVA
jgi:L-aspartate oxidase